MGWGIDFEKLTRQAKGSGGRKPPKPKPKPRRRRPAPRRPDPIRQVGRAASAASGTVRGASIARTGRVTSSGRTVTARRESSTDRALRLAGGVPLTRSRARQQQAQIAALGVPLDRLINRSSGGKSIGGYLQNLGRGAVQFWSTIPGQAQMVGEAGLYPFVAGANAVAGGFENPLSRNRGPRPSNPIARTERRLREDLQAGGAGIKQDLYHRWWEPIVVERSPSLLAARHYEDPFPYWLEVAGTKGIVGRTPTGAARVTRRVAPGTNLGARADRFVSTLSAAERAAEAARAGVQNFAPGPGKRYREPRRLTSRVSRDPDVEGQRTIEIDRGDYSADVTARARQRFMDRRGEWLTKTADRARARVEAAEPAYNANARFSHRVKANLLKPVSTQARYDRAQKKLTYNRKDVRNAMAQSAEAIGREKAGPEGSEIGKLAQPRINHKGDVIELLSPEQAAYNLHVMDALGDTITNGVRGRGGKTARQLRNMAIATSGRGRTRSRKRGQRTKVQDQQAQNLLDVPEHLLNLVDEAGNDLLKKTIPEIKASKAPKDVKRVAAAVVEARNLNRQSQYAQIRSKVITPKTARSTAERASALLQGGMRHGSEAISILRTRERRLNREVTRKITEARKRGDRVEEAKLLAERRANKRKYNAAIARVREDATRDSPEVQAARTAAQEADAALRRVREAAPTKARIKRVWNAGRIKGRGERNYELSGRRRGDRTEPGQPRRGQDTVTGGKGQVGRDQFGRKLRGVKVTFGEKGNKQKRFSIALAGGRRDPMVPSPPGTGVRPRNQDYGIGTVRGRAYMQQLRGEGKLYRVNQETKEYTTRGLMAMTRQRDQLFENLRRLEEKNLGFTTPTRPDLIGRSGIYLRAKPADELAIPRRPPAGGKWNVDAQVYRTKGFLQKALNVNMHPHLVYHMHQRAMQNRYGPISRQAVRELIGQIAYHVKNPRAGKLDKDGLPEPEWINMTGDRMDLLRKVDGDRVVLINENTLRSTINKLDELEQGEWLDQKASANLFKTAEQVRAEGGKLNDYVVVNKAAAEVWNEAMTAEGFWKHYDKGLNYWKGGLLALSPRWYINNSLGLALQYSVMTGFDVMSMMQANRGAFRRFAGNRRLTKAVLGKRRADRLRQSGRDKQTIARAMERRSPEAILDTMADELLLSAKAETIKLVGFGFKVNSRIEEFWRKSAYLSQAKRKLRQEGLTRRKHYTPSQIAEHIDNMPATMVHSIVKDVNYFIGNYRKFNKFERTIVKRIIPFYSWLRVIARLTFTLPFKHPVRAAAMNVLEMAQTAGLNPNDHGLPYYLRGAWRFIGDRATQTWSSNPFQTMMPFLVALGARSPEGALAEEFVTWNTPYVQTVYSLASGKNAFGRGYTAPASQGGGFGGGGEHFNPLQNTFDKEAPRPGRFEVFAGAALPAQRDWVRRLSSWNRTPYDTASSWALMSYGLHRMFGGDRDRELEDKLFLPERKRKDGREPSKWNPIMGLGSVSTFRQDDAKLRKFLEDEYKKGLKAVNKANE